MKMECIEFTFQKNSLVMIMTVLFGMAKTAEMTYMSVTEDYGNGDNYISSLNPGESIQVNMAWIVNENDLDNMYLNLNGDGAAFEFSESMLDVGLVDIRQ